MLTVLSVVDAKLDVVEVRDLNLVDVVLHVGVDVFESVGADGAIVGADVDFAPVRVVDE